MAQIRQVKLAHTVNTQHYSEEVENDQDIHSNQCQKRWLTWCDSKKKQVKAHLTSKRRHFKLLRDRCSRSGSQHHQLIFVRCFRHQSSHWRVRLIDAYRLLWLFSAVSSLTNIQNAMYNSHGLEALFLHSFFNLSSYIFFLLIPIIILFRGMLNYLTLPFSQGNYGLNCMHVINTKHHFVS